jgi:hypothetical protein
VEKEETEVEKEEKAVEKEEKKVEKEKKEVNKEEKEVDKEEEVEKKHVLDADALVLAFESTDHNTLIRYLPVPVLYLQLQILYKLCTLRTP